MREILFRGKRKDNGEWVCGDLLQDKDLEKCYIEYFEYYSSENGPQRDYCQCEVIPETVGQYTGLTDKNGKKIFEGDIVRMYFEGESSGYDEEGVSYNYDFYGHKIGVVSFGSNGTFINAKHGELHIDAEMVEGWTPTRRARLAGYRSEVIGNIHDNPELMEEAQE